MLHTLKSPAARGWAEEVVVYGSRAVYGLAMLPLAVAASAVRGHYGARRA